MVSWPCTEDGEERLRRVKIFEIVPVLQALMGEHKQCVWK